MKKVLVALCTVCALAFTACEEGDLSQILSVVTGNAELTVASADAGTSHQTNDQIKFSSAVANAINENNIACTIIIGANLDLTKVDELTYPYFGVNFTDTVAATYTFPAVNQQLMTSFIGANIITKASETNLLVIAESDTSWYLSTGGSAQITEWANFGQTMKGNFNNVKMYYVTKTKLEEVQNLTAVQWLTTNLDDYFKSMTINGNFNCRRMDIQNIIANMITEE
ncbi:MAG: hypothetical protein MJZ81_08750 [Bacteroidales bacterium]|nr:hypothetical protein [Bacteroidales bacterium]